MTTGNIKVIMTIIANQQPTPTQLSHQMRYTIIQVLSVLLGQCCLCSCVSAVCAPGSVLSVLLGQVLSVLLGQVLSVLLGQVLSVLLGQVLSVLLGQVLSVLLGQCCLCSWVSAVCAPGSGAVCAPVSVLSVLLGQCCLSSWVRCCCSGQCLTYCLKGALTVLWRHWLSRKRVLSFTPVTQVNLTFHLLTNFK